jgi:hypothetical protein
MAYELNCPCLSFLLYQTMTSCRCGGAVCAAPLSCFSKEPRKVNRIRKGRPFKAILYRHVRQLPLQQPVRDEINISF